MRRSNLVEDRFDLVLVDPFSFFLAPAPTLSVPMVKQDALYGSIRGTRIKAVAADLFTNNVHTSRQFVIELCIRIVY